MSRRRERQSNPRFFRASALLALLALVLSACGTKIDTALDVSLEGSGSRTINLVLERTSDNESGIVGGAEALDASIQRHLPEGLSYAGLSESETEISTTFSFTFDSPADYRAQVADLLAASDRDFPSGFEFLIEDTPFVKGLVINEPYSSADLLGWLWQGLVADGVVDASNANNMWEQGATVVSFNGINHEASFQINLEEVTDNGFASVAMTTSMDGEAITRSILFTLDSKAQFRANEELFTSYFDALRNAGMTVEQNEAEVGVSWLVTFEAAAPAAMAALTDEALSSAETSFSVTSSSDPADPLAVLTQVSEFAECGAICSPTAATLTDTIITPTGFSASGWNHSTDEAGNVILQLAGEASDLVLSRVVDFTRADMNLAVDPSGASTVTLEFDVPDADAALVGSALEELLANGESAQVETRSADGMTTYVATLSGEDAAHFEDAYRTWSQAPDTSFVVTDTEGSSFLHRSYAVSGVLPLPSALASRLPAEGLGIEVSMTSGDTIDAANYYPLSAVLDGSSASFTGERYAEFYFEAAGTPLAAWIFYGAIALVVLLLIAAAVVFRERIGTTVRSWRPAPAAAGAGVAGMGTPDGVSVVSPLPGSDLEGGSAAPSAPPPMPPGEQAPPMPPAPAAPGESEADFL